MRFLVSCGMDRADGESLSTAETVPGVNPTCWATAFSVMTAGPWPDFLICPMSTFGFQLRLGLTSCRERSFAIALAVRFRSAQSEIKYVQITNHGQEEGVVNSDVIRNPSLRNRDECSANNRHDHDSRAVARERPEFGHAQREDAREHNGIEKAYEDDAVHGEVPGRQHRSCDQS